MASPSTYETRGQWAWSIIGGSGTPAIATGTASEFTIEGLEREVDQDRRPGAGGALSYAGDFNPITATLSLMSITDGVRSAAMESVCSNATINASAVFQNTRDACDIGTYSISMRGILIKYPIGWKFSTDKGEVELVLGVNYYTETFKGKTFTYNPDEMEWIWNGTNLWANRKLALGV